MCVHEFYLSTACGHHFPKLPQSTKPNFFFKDTAIPVPQSLTCIAVKLALKFYHDQVVYLPADMNCGAKVEIPKLCPIVHTPPGGPTQRMIREHEHADMHLHIAMLNNGLGRRQQDQINLEAAQLMICSNRARPGEHDPAELKRHRELQYPRNMFSHAQILKAYQSRDKRGMMPNVTYIKVDFGCGGPFAAKCLTGWDAGGLLSQRLHIWSDAATHLKPCNHECFAGWSGVDLNRYRQQTWAGDNLRRWGEKNYSKVSHEHILKHTKRSVVVAYGNCRYPLNDEVDQDDKEIKRKPEPPIGQADDIPGIAKVPVSTKLYTVLREMDPVRFPAPPLSEDAPVEDILGRLPEAFEEQDPLSREGSRPPANTTHCVECGSTLVNEPVAKSEPVPLSREGSGLPVNTTQGSESGSTLVNEPVAKPEPVPLEAAETAEARRQKAREVPREKLIAKPEPVPLETAETAEARRQKARANLREKLKRCFPTERGR